MNFSTRRQIVAHYARPVFLAEAARQACLSTFYFNRPFTQAFNETPHEFITRRRIEQAKRLLLAGNHSVTEICFEVGYESLGSFSTRFSSLTGLSPAAFRGEAPRIFGGFGARWPLYYIPPASSASSWQSADQVPKDRKNREALPRRVLYSGNCEEMHYFQRLSYTQIYVLDQDAARDFSWTMVSAGLQSAPRASPSYRSS